MAHRFGGVPTYRIISAKKSTNERRRATKKNTNPVKLRNALNIVDSENHQKIREMLVDEWEESD